ncbi:MAG TPA: hypothetical protein VH257_00860 [Chloroflexota bacterium]|nr:hypothetical protein [Chloroflexota bacterium]
MTEQTELTFSAGERATLDLRDSEGDVRIEDGEPETVRISSSGGRSPFVLREGDTFRIRLAGGGRIAVAPDTTIKVIVPAAVRLRLTRRGETEVTRQEPVGTAGAAEGAAAGAAAGAGAGDGPPPVDLSEFARYMSEQSRRIFDQMTEKVRQGGFDANVATEDVARRLDEAAGRIDEQVQRVAVRVEREVERAFDFVGRAAKRTEGQHRHEVHRQHRAEERAQRHAERSGERAQRAAERAAERAGRRPPRGRWWFSERLEEAVREATSGVGGAPGGAPGEATGGAGPGAGRPKASAEERRVILDMLAQGTISAEQAASLLDALGG